MSIRLPLLVLACAIVVGTAGLARGADQHAVTPVDHGRILAPVVAGAPLVIKEFSTANTDFGTGENEKKEKARATAAQMKATAPGALLQSLQRQLADKGSFPSVVVYQEGAMPEGAMILEGEFTVLNPGSRGARFWVGFGAGRSRVCVKGRVLDAAGTVLLDFDHCRSGNLGWFGGKAEGMMFTDVAGTAEKVSQFLDEWAKGKKAP